MGRQTVELGDTKNGADVAREGSSVAKPPFFEFHHRLLAFLWPAQFTCDRRVPAAAVLVAGRQVVAAAERSRVDSPVMIITDVQRNAGLVSPTHERLSVGTQHGFQCLRGQRRTSAAAGSAHRLMV